MPTTEASSLDQAKASTISAVYRKVALRLIPLLFLCYLAAYLDRVNVSFAKQQMQSELGLSALAYGIGAGIFFIGYFLFEVPSNLLMERIGARKTLLRIMVLWGVTASLMMFAHEEWTFYVLRFLLGAFEAGFAPGIILYLSKWVPSTMLARFMGLFLTGSAVAGIIGAPLSGWIISQFSGVAGLSGWQWMFLLQGIPSVILGIVVFFVLPDTPRDARWLTADEVRETEKILAEEAASGHRHVNFVAALRDWRIYALSFGYFCISGGIFLVTFWLPTALAQYKATTGPEVLALLAAVPYTAAAVSMIIVGRRSDRTGERRWHCVVPSFVAAVSLVGAIYSTSLPLTVAFFTVAAAAVWAALAVFWSIPPIFYSGVAAAGAIATINSLGNLNGLVNPFIVGAFQTGTGSLIPGLWLTVIGLVVGGVVLARTVRRVSPAQSDVLNSQRM